MQEVGRCGYDESLIRRSLKTRDCASLMTFVMSPSRSTCYSLRVSPSEAFDQVEFLKALPTAERERLLPQARLRRLDGGAVVWSENADTACFSFVVRGRVKFVKVAEDGRETILEMAGNGELLCANAVFCYAPYCCTGVAFEDETEIVDVPRREVLEAVERQPSAARALVRELTRRGVAMCQRVEQLAAVTVERRMALLLSRLAARAGIPDGNGRVRVPIGLKRQDLADLCGTTLETAIRVMSRWRREGIVASRAGELHILKSKVLEDIAHGRPERAGRLVSVGRS
jgi:CRP/FNR family transcriptional regulator, cyclic AMP receptor protein